MYTIDDFRGKSKYQVVSDKNTDQDKIANYESQQNLIKGMAESYNLRRGFDTNMVNIFKPVTDSVKDPNNQLNQSMGSLGNTLNALNSLVSSTQLPAIKQENQIPAIKSINPIIPVEKESSSSLSIAEVKTILDNSEDKLFGWIPSEVEQPLDYIISCYFGAINDFEILRLPKILYGHLFGIKQTDANIGFALMKLTEKSK